MAFDGEAETTVVNIFSPRSNSPAKDTLNKDYMCQQFPTKHGILNTNVNLFFTNVVSLSHSELGSFQMNNKRKINYLFVHTLCSTLDFA